MKIKQDAEVPASAVTLPGAEKVTMQVLLGPDDDSDDIIMRLFTVAPGGCTPYHTHDYEHLVRILGGRGRAVDESGAEYELATGQSMFVVPNERHQFTNPYDEPFEFTCTIPNPEKRKGC